MVLDFTSGVPHIAIPAVIGSLVAEFFGFSDAWVLLGAAVGVITYYAMHHIVKFAIRAISKLSLHHR